MSPRSGDLYWAFTEGPRKRPVVVASRDDLNLGKYILVVPLTSQQVEVRRRLPNCIFFESGEYGLPKDCVAQTEALTQILKDDLDMEFGPIGRLNAAKYREFVRAIGYSLNAECEPQ